MTTNQKHQQPARDACGSSGLLPIVRGLAFAAPPLTFAPLRFGLGTWHVISGGTRRMVRYPFPPERAERRQ